MDTQEQYRIFLSPPHQGGDELAYLEKVLKSNWLAPGGEFVKKFETRINELANRKFCIALNSGTAAIHLALKVLGVEEGDHVICQTFSFVATANPIAYLGAHPVFIDSERETWNMDPVLLEKSIIDLQKSNIHPKAIIYAHIYGNPAKVDALVSISEKYDIPLVEDAAEALGSKINSQPVGTFGKVSIMSFNGNKVVTTSGGGALLTDDSDLAKRAFNLSTQARDQIEPYTHTEVGYNYRMSNLCAALGLAQLNYLDAWVEKKQKIFERYQKINGDQKKIEWIDDQAKVLSNRWLSVFLVESVTKRNDILEALHKKNIESRNTWKPLHLQHIFKNQKSYISGVAKDLFERGICLPSGVGISEEEQAEIMLIIKAIV